MKLADIAEKVKNKTGEDYWYFAQQYFYSPNQPELEYYQTENEFFYKWKNVNANFRMPINILVNGRERRIYPKIEYQSFKVKKHSQIEVMDWKFYVQPVKKS